jgi:hypothetical protein
VNSLGSEIAKIAREEELKQNLQEWQNLCKWIVKRVKYWMQGLMQSSCYIREIVQVRMIEWSICIGNEDLHRAMGWGLGWTGFQLKSPLILLNLVWLAIELFKKILLFIRAYKAWVISPPCPHPLPYHPLRPLPLPPPPQYPAETILPLFLILL